MPARYLPGMLRTLSLLPLLFAIAACSSTGAGKLSKQQTAPEYRTAAASLLGADLGKQTSEESAGDAPRIRLSPSPGNGRMLGEKPREVLESDKRSGAYVAFTGQVPVTKYFRVLGSADCEDWIYLQLANPSMVKTFPKYYVSPDYDEDKAPAQCVRLFRKKYKESSDERLVGADGVIFDAETAKFFEVDGMAIGHKKLSMAGWAIKFVDPSREEIAERLSKRAATAIDVLQMKAAAHWVEVNGASDFAPAMRSLLPMKSKGESLYGWKDADRALLKALAAVEPASAPIAPYMAILEAGKPDAVLPGPVVSAPVSGVQDIPFVAANVLVCRNLPGTADYLENVLLNANVLQHRMAAAKGLLALGERQRIERLLAENRLGSEHGRVFDLLKGDSSPFKCPYRSNSSV